MPTLILDRDRFVISSPGPVIEQRRGYRSNSVSRTSERQRGSSAVSQVRRRLHNEGEKYVHCSGDRSWKRNAARILREAARRRYVAGGKKAKR